MKRRFTLGRSNIWGSEQSPD